MNILEFVNYIFDMSGHPEYNVKKLKQNIVQITKPYLLAIVLYHKKAEIVLVVADVCIIKSFLFTTKNNIFIKNENKTIS